MASAVNIRVEAEGVAITFSIVDGAVAVEQTKNKIPAAAAPKAVLSPPPPPPPTEQQAVASTT